MTATPPHAQAVGVPLGTVLREWGRIGLTGFGGPPAHIALLRTLMTERGWMPEREFEDAIAACNLLPGPASTQLAILCARRVAGPAGAVVGGLAFIVPAVVLILVLSLLFLAQAPPAWIRGAGAGAGAAVAADRRLDCAQPARPELAADRAPRRARAAAALDRLRRRGSDVARCWSGPTSCSC